MKHRFALITLLTAILLAAGTTARVQRKPAGPSAAARKVTITLVRWPYT